MYLNALDAMFSMSWVNHGMGMDAGEVQGRGENRYNENSCLHHAVLTFTRFVPAGAGMMTVNDYAK